MWWWDLDRTLAAASIDLGAPYGVPSWSPMRHQGGEVMRVGRTLSARLMLWVSVLP